MRVRLIGLPTDSHSSYLRGAAAGPAAIRAALASDHSNRAAECGLEPVFEDIGDLPLREDDGDPVRIGAAASEAARAGAVPISLGGDHDRVTSRCEDPPDPRSRVRGTRRPARDPIMVTGPIVAALAAVHGPLNILHFDAHPDLYEDYEGDPLSHASPFARIMEAGHARRLVQFGIRTLNAHCREQAARFGVEYPAVRPPDGLKTAGGCLHRILVEMRDFAPERVPIPEAPLYISVDLDGFDPAFAPGVAHHEPGGPSSREVLKVLHRVPGGLVGADIVELDPGRDVNGVTATLAAKLVKELAALAAKGAQ